MNRVRTKSNVVKVFWDRGGFSGGDLVTCHPLFSDMALQNQILVSEPCFLWISKFIRKYFLPRQFSRMYSSCYFYEIYLLATCVHQIIPDLKWYRNLLYREPKSEKWCERCPKSQIKLFMFILLILLYSNLAR